MVEEKYVYKDKLVEINFLVHHPRKLQENLPVLLFLHGIGERGQNIDDIKKYSFPKYINNMEIPYITICPQCSKGNFWDYHLRDIENILDLIIEKYKCNRNRICVMGSSMGACGALNYIMQRPERFKCVISSAGRATLPIKENTELIKDKSFLLYHGTDDDVIDCDNSKKLFELLKQCGVEDVELKIIEGGNHYVCSTAYEDPYLYKWLKKKL